MPLLTDAICFGKPSGDFVIDLVRVHESERVEMISWRESFDTAEAGIFETPGQNDVAVDPVVANNESGKAHPHLKCDPGLLRQNRDRPVPLRGRQEFVEDHTHILRFAGEMRCERVAAAGVRLVAISDEAAATWTTPQRRQPLRRLHVLSCRINPPMSTKPHASTAPPSAKRQTLNPSIRTFLPVGWIPKNAPRCFPSETQ